MFKMKTVIELLSGCSYTVMCLNKTCVYTCAESDRGAGSDDPAGGAKRESVVSGQTDPCLQTTQHESTGEND